MRSRNRPPARERPRRSAAGAARPRVRPARLGAAALRADGAAARGRPAGRARGARGRRADHPATLAEAIRNEPHGKDETLVQQILEHRRDVGEAIPTRLFAGEADGRLVAHTELYCEDGVGQVENVFTLPDYRSRGLARSLVLHAVAESHAAGIEFTFLVADADDWPQRLYEKLGFETVGRYARFLKQLVPASAGGAMSEALKSSPGGSSDPPGFHSKFQVAKSYGLT